MEDGVAMINYEEFSAGILKLTGIDLSQYKERQMKRRIDSLISKNEIKGYDEYLEALKNSVKLYEEFMNYITINVSEFFRNKEQWALLKSEVVPYLINNFGKKLKIWSAACSTGEEPYSLVMLLSEFLPLSDIHIIATDIDKQVLSKAKSGVYKLRELAGVPKEYLNKYFDEVEKNTYKVKDEIRACVEFKIHNLLADPYPKDCDLIVCRNVMIYFTEEAKREIYIKFNEVLKKQAVLFVGSTEQIIGYQRIGYESYKSFFYKKA